MNTKKDFSDLNYATKAMLFTHLAAMEQAGLPADKSFANLRLQGEAQQRVDAARKILARGKGISQAGKISGLFNQLETHIIHAATQSGSPAITYKRFADHYTEKNRLQRLVRARMKMPVLMFLLSLFIAPLSALVTGSISTAAYLWRVAAPLIAVILIWQGIVFLRGYYRSHAFRDRNSGENPIDSIALKLPIFGSMNVRSNANQFYESLGLMLQAGLPMFEAVPLANQTVQNSLIREEFSKILPQLHEGKTLSQSLEKLRFLGQWHIVELVKTGEISGTIPEMLWRYCTIENEAISNFQEQVAAWVPRILYGMVAMWMAYSIFKSNAFMPNIPEVL